jgi:hypothetical protein
MKSIIWRGGSYNFVQDLAIFVPYRPFLNDLPFIAI